MGCSCGWPLDPCSRKFCTDGKCDMEKQHARPQRPVTADYMEPWLAGFNAARDGTPHDDPEALIGRMTHDFHMSGSELARSVNEGTTTPEQAEKIAGLPKL